MSFTLDQFSLKGKVAIVTGAGGRPNSIGEAYCFGLAAAGATVVAADVNAEGAQAVAERLRAAGHQAIGIGVDITSESSVAAMAASVESQFGGADILVNNAALMVELDYGSGVMGCSMAEWDRVMNVNLKGALLCARAIVPLMRKRGGGRIVNQVSAGAYPAETLYGITKIALVGLTTTLARELGHENINVNAIAPGNTQSGAGQSLSTPDSEFLKISAAKCVIRVLGKPDDLVGALLLLCSPAGDWMSGQVLHVDGGLTLRP